MYTVLRQNTLKEAIKNAIVTYCLRELRSSLRIYPTLYITHDLLVNTGLEKMPVPV